MLAAKTALGLRVDALGEEDQEEEQRAMLGLSSRIKLENQLRRLEGKAMLPKGTNVGPSGEIVAPGQFTLKETRRYNVDADGVNGEALKKDKSKKSRELDAQSDEEMKDGEDDDDDDDDDGSADEDAAAASKPKVAKLSKAEYERLADLAGLSMKKFKRKYERGDVQLGADGTPKVFSKKEIKKMRKAEANSTPAKAEAPAKEGPVSEKKRKRKHDDDDEDEAPEPKKEKKQKKKKRHSEA